ncbi:MAG: NB-ARC domain-containing protein, partial [Roseiflexaceae bacterium]
DTDIYTAWLCCLLQCTVLPSNTVPDAATLRQEFARFPRRLVICDDVQRAHHLHAYLAALPAGTHVLVTTRYIHVAHELHWNMVHIGAMAHHDAQALLAHQLATAQDYMHQWQWVNDIISAVDGHPLALQLIAKRLRLESRSPGDWEEFVTPILQGIPQQAFSDFAVHPDIAAGFIALFAPNYQMLSTLEFPILHSIAVCDPDHPVSTRLLMAMWHLNEYQIIQVMEKLSELLFVIPHPNGWTQHSIMHSYTRILMNQWKNESHLQTKLIDALVQLLATHHARGTYHEFDHDYHQCVNALAIAMTHDLERAVTLMHALTPYMLATGQYLNLYQKSQHLLQRVHTSGDDKLTARVSALCAMTAFEYAVHVGKQREQYLRQGFALLQDAKALNPDPHDQLAAEITMRIGLLLSEIAHLDGRYTLKHINAAIEFYARVTREPGLDTLLYSQLCQNRANVYLRRAELNPPTSIDDCQKAIEYC